MLFVTAESFDIPPYELPSLEESNTFPVFVDREIKAELRRILGSKLYNAFIAAYDASVLEVDPVVLPERWQKLVDGDVYTHLGKEYEWKGMEEAFVPFVYAMWTKYRVNDHTNNGIIESKVENGISVSPAERICKGYNEYATLVGDSNHSAKDTLCGYLWYSADTFFDLVSSEYPTISAYLVDRTKYPKKINRFSL